MMRLPGVLEAWAAPAANEFLCLISCTKVILDFLCCKRCTGGSVLCEAGRFHGSSTVMNFQCGENVKVQGAKKLVLGE